MVVLKYNYCTGTGHSRVTGSSVDLFKGSISWVRLPLPLIQLYRPVPVALCASAANLIAGEVLRSTMSLQAQVLGYNRVADAGSGVADALSWVDRTVRRQQ